MTKEQLHNSNVWIKLKVYLHYCIMQYTLKHSSIHWKHIETLSFERFFSSPQFNPKHDTAWEHYWRFEKDIII